MNRKRILLALDDRPPQKGLVDFCCFIANLLHSRISCAVLEEAESTVPADGSDTAGADERQIPRSLHEVFVCHEALHDPAVKTMHSSRDLIRESKFADVLILDPGISLSGGTETAPTSLAASLLQAAECPILLAPERFRFLEEVVFAYDGGAAAMYAIKQFCCLFPELTKLRLAVLQVSDGKEQGLTCEKLLREWLEAHFEHISYYTAEGDPSGRLAQELLFSEHSLVVLGKHDRTFPGRFREGTAENILRVIRNPLFIAGS